MNLVEKARRLVRDRGFKSAIQITLELMNDKHSVEEITTAISSLECDDIKRIEYTNTYVAPYKTKDLFVYNPHRTKKRGKKRYPKRKKKTEQ